MYKLHNYTIFNKHISTSNCKTHFSVHITEFLLLLEHRTVVNYLLFLESLLDNLSLKQIKCRSQNYPPNFSKTIFILTLSMLGVNLSRQHFEIFFRFSQKIALDISCKVYAKCLRTCSLFFTRKQVLTFHANCLLKRQFA